MTFQDDKKWYFYTQISLIWNILIWYCIFHFKIITTSTFHEQHIVYIGDADQNILFWIWWLSTTSLGQYSWCSACEHLTVPVKLKRYLPVRVVYSSPNFQRHILYVCWILTTLEEDNVSPFDSKSVPCADSQSKLNNTYLQCDLTNKENNPSYIDPFLIYTWDLMIMIMKIIWFKLFSSYPESLPPWNAAVLTCRGATGRYCQATCRPSFTAVRCIFGAYRPGNLYKMNKTIYCSGMGKYSEG